MKKKNNQTAKIMQQGGLMIEALAMLGLIAVVTPTMYKKSAERTLEVEDINTATTVRTYMNAAEAYIANNYGDLMVNEFSTRNEDGKLVPVASGSKVVTVTPEQMSAYLPYKFDTDRSLYDYNTPQVRIVNNGTNLTAFALFPAKQDAANGIGQERTSRIASLVGANGGYMPDDKTARGVGGIWNLNDEDMAKIFSDVNPNAYSLVAASSNVISDVNGGELDNDKYLQRTLEGDPNNPESYKGQLWRNTMHTDLYMGNHLQGETQSIHADLQHLNSIRDVKSLIIGSERANPPTTTTDAEGNTTTTEPTTDNELYGLYISGKDGDNYADAYIGGALRATEEQFVVTSRGGLNPDSEGTAYTGAQMVFGKNGTEYNFEVDENGDIYDYGHKGMLYNRFKDEADNFVDIAHGVVEITNPDNTLRMHIMDDDTFFIQQDIDDKSKEATNTQINMVMNGYKGIDNQLPNDAASEGDEAGKYGHDSLGNYIGPKYNNSPKFPVHVGSNMAVEGVLAAGQIDTQHLRTASFQSGSEKIDDQYKWLEVDKDGVRIRDPKGRNHLDTSRDGKSNKLIADVGRKTSFIVDEDRVAMRVGSSSYKDTTSLSEFGLDDHPGQLVLQEDNDGASATLAGQAHQIGFNATDYVTRNEDNTTTTVGNISMKNSLVKMDIGVGKTGREIVFSNANEDAFTHSVENTDSDYRVLMKGGWLDLQNSGFHVTKYGKRSDGYSTNAPVFSVGQMDRTFESTNIFNNDSADVQTDDNGTYATATHGPALFTNFEYTQGHPMDYIQYMSIGTYNDKAGVNIVAPDRSSSEQTTKDNYIKNVLIVDQSEDVDSKNYPVNAVSLEGYTKNGTSRVSVGAKLENRGEPGTVYIRKGMIDIVSGANQGEEYKEAFLAHEGAGVVRAARFVANNIDHNGNHTYKVPTKLTHEEANLYNTGDKKTTFTRYDTYMVNPAYTSVMNDIKLASRGGARLSDILPDFINKGIYVANNTNKSEYFPTSGTWGDFDYQNASDNTDVSPYLGKVPAPQCPPGYGRVITVAPTGFKMAQAGGIELKDDKFMVKEDENGPGDAFQDPEKYNGENGIVSQFKKGKQNYLTEYRQLRVGYEEGGKVELDGKIRADWWNRADDGSGYVDINFQGPVSVKSLSNNFPIKMCKQTEETTDDKGCTLVDTYVLSSNSANAFKPLLFQQSTYLKTAVIPICSNGDTKYGQTCTGEKNGRINYTQGWAVLMGFIYPYNLYQGVIDALGTKAQPLAQETSTKTKWYWNIFPVLRGSLEAYATVYCHYDRTNIWKGYNEADGYDYMNAATGFTPTGTDKTRRERLNDPTLKYNELW